MRCDISAWPQGFRNVSFRANPFLPVLTLFAFALEAPSCAAESSSPTIADFMLSNGLELVVIPDHRAPVVTHMIWYKVGSADETPGKSGLAHFLEPLMFTGTAKQ